MSRKGRNINKQLIIYVLVGLLAISLVSFTTMRFSDVKTPEDLAREDEQRRIADAIVRFCGLESEANSTTYITEYVLPSECTMPLGIAVEEDRIWYISTKQGILGSYHLANDRFEEFTIPSWPPRASPSPTVISMAWDVKIDMQGNVWFTDDRQNLLWRFDRSGGNFDSFSSPANGPISFDFDSDGNIYLVGVRSNSLYFGKVSDMKPGTLEGFTEIRLPLDSFAGIQDSRVISGAVVVDRDRNVVWTSLLAFQNKGQIFRYNPAINEIAVYSLPPDLTSPQSMTVDHAGNVWATDHQTSIFFMLNPDDGSLTRYVTSTLSPRITGGPPPEGSYTLPYWMQTDQDNNIWFNQHIGNKITKFDPVSNTMIEYWIPTQNSEWGDCPEGAATCGISMALQFSVGPSGQVWFTEWTENKIGLVRADLPVPLSISAPDQITVSRGGSTEIRIQVRSQSDIEVQMIASGTFTGTGTLGTSTGIFSQQSLNLSEGSSRQVSYLFSPSTSLAPGQYTLMLGADQGDVTVLKAVRVNVI